MFDFYNYFLFLYLLLPYQIFAISSTYQIYAHIVMQIHIFRSKFMVEHSKRKNCIGQCQIISKIIIMRLENPSQLGPWQDPQSAYQRTNITTFKQQLILPRVTQQKPYILKIRDQKQLKQTKPFQMKQINLELKHRKHNSSFQQPHQYKESIGEHNSHTLSFDVPKIGKYNRSFVNEKNRRYQNQYEFVEPIEEAKSTKREVSKVDLMADYLQNSQKDGVQDKSQKIWKEREKQYSKKRSLMELVKYLKSGGMGFDKQETGERSPKKIGKYYQQYRSILNLSLQQSSYIPSFQARRSIHSKKK